MKECELSDMIVSEIEVKVSLQSMLGKSIERLSEVVSVDWSEEHLYNLELIVTLGFDSSSGYNNPHQRYEDDDNKYTEAQQSLLVSSMIICKLSSKLGILEDELLSINLL